MITAMHVDPPKLRRHIRGQWCCYWGGRTHYFGTDRAAAQERYRRSLKEWGEWRTARATQRPKIASSNAMVANVVDRFLAYKELEGGRSLRTYYAKHLRRFNGLFGGVRADLVRTPHVQELKEAMLPNYAPKTINHDLIAVRAMMSWASAVDMIPAVNLKPVKNMPLGPPPDKSMPIETVRNMIYEASHKLRPWLAIHYLALMRPSEVIRVVHGQGRWAEDCVFRLDRGKVDFKARFPRHVVFSDQALAWLLLAEPVWSRLDSYYRAVARTFGLGGSHHLRHSAATHLIQAGANRADVDLLLGHVPSRVSLIYAHIEFQPLRRTAALLSL